MRPLLLILTLTLAIVGTASARPPRKAHTAADTLVGHDNIVCDVWDRFDTRSHGLPKIVKTAADCYITRFNALDASFPVDPNTVCVPTGDALITNDNAYVCAPGVWLMYNTFTAMTKTGYLYCQYEADSQDNPGKFDGTPQYQTLALPLAADSRFPRLARQYDQPGA